MSDNKQQLQQERDEEILINRITNQIRQSLELNEILNISVVEIRSLLKTDRVIVYQFHDNGSGEVITESSNQDRVSSLLGLHFPADDIPKYARDRFLKTRDRSIVNVSLLQMGVSSLYSEETGKVLENPQIYYRPADPCHIEYLKVMGVEFSLVIPIFHTEKLWGLLVSHHTESRVVLAHELQLVQRLVDQMSVAISHAILLDKYRKQAQRETIINRIATLLKIQPVLPLQIALVETITVLQASGGRLYITTEGLKNEQTEEIRNLSPEISSSFDLYTCGIQPIIDNFESSLPNLIFTNQQENTQILPITDIEKESNLQDFARAFRELGIRSLLIIPLHYERQHFGYLTIFAEEMNTETCWAGYFDPYTQQMQPRKSFDLWRELKNNQPRNWNNSEIDLAQALGHQFSLAIYQYRRYHIRN